MTAAPDSRIAATSSVGAQPPRRWPARGLLLSTALSVASNAMVAVLVPWLVLSRTDSPAQAGLVGSVSVAAAVPALLFGGPLIDRWGRRRVSVGADLLSAAAVIALPVLDRTLGLTLISTLALVALGALFDGPGGAARESARPDVARRAGRPLAVVNSRGEAAEGIGGIVGPALAGIGIGVLGALGSLWVAAGLLLLSAAVTAAALPRDVRAAGEAEPYLRAALAGLRLVWTDRVLRGVALLGAAAMIFIGPLTLVFAAQLQPLGDPGALAAVTTALAIGGIVGALGYGALAARLRRRTVLLGTFTLGAIGLSTMAVVVALTSEPIPLIAAAAITGLAIGPVNPVLAALTQERTPVAMLGRVVATTWSLSLMATPLGILGAGLLLEATGPAVALAVISAGITGSAVYGAVALRRIEPQDVGSTLPR